MIKRYIQNLLQPRHFVHTQSDGSQYLPVSGDMGLLARAVRGLRDYIAESSHQHSIEAENRKAIEHLHSLTDEHLRDIGITRMDISRAVRFGKENI